MAKFNMFNTKEGVRTGIARRVGAGALAIGLVGGATACGNEGGGIGDLAGNLTGNSMPYGPSCENHKDKALDVGMDISVVPENAVTADKFIARFEEKVVNFARMKDHSLREKDVREIRVTPEQRDDLVESANLMENWRKPEIKRGLAEARERGDEILFAANAAVINSEGLVYDNGTLQGQLCVYSSEPGSYDFPN